VRQDVARDSGAVVGDGQRRVAPGCERWGDSVLGAGHDLLVEGERDHAGVAEGVARVEREIDDHALELRRIGDDGCDAVCELDLDLDALGHRALQQLLRALDDVGEADHPRSEDLPSAEGEQLAGQVGRPIRSFRDLVDIGDLLRVRQREAENAAVPADHKQHVVEVMCDAAGQLADRFEALGLPEPRLERAARG